MLENFVKTYDDILPKDICKTLVNLYDVNLKQKITATSNKSYMNFNEVLLDANLHNDLYDFIFSKTESIKKSYFLDLNINYLPNMYSYELIRIKKYQNNDYDQFGNHVDCYDLNSSKRYLAFLFYLNDIEIGGETEFIDTLSLKIVPKSGRVVVFPPTFMFPHIGHKPVSANKFILSTYLHYA